jgi:multicomponent Na+:H+ antiporter subunit F
MAEVVISWIVMPLLFGGALLSLVRLVRGPSLPDRVVALDLMTVAAIGVVAVYAAATGQPSLLDVALVLALLSFLGVVAFATYVQRSSQDG